MLRVSVALLLGLLGIAPGAPPQPKTRPTPAPAPVLEGVVKGPDGKPVEGALVIARATSARFGETPPHVRTDASGRFRLALEPATLYDVRVEARGLAAQRLERVRPGGGVTVTLEKGGVIEGTVRDGASGTPIAEARVAAAVISSSLPWEPGTGVVETRTDAKGRYRLEGVGRGFFEVSALKRGYGRARRPTVAAGGPVDLFLFPGPSVRGTVRGPGRRSVAGALVRAEREKRSSSPDAPPEKTDSQGRFEILGLEAGSYRLAVRHPDFAPGVVSGVVVEPTADAEAHVDLTPAVRVVGRLVDPRGRPTSARVVIQELNGKRTPPSLADLLGVEAGADGRFRMEGVPPGSHALVVRAPGFAPKRVDFDASAAPVDVGDLVLETGLTIRGRVRDAAALPVAGARIEAFQPRAEVSYMEARSEADGSFVLAGLGPGTRRLNVSAPGYSSLQRPVEVGTQDADIVLKPGATIAGEVVDEAGKPVESYQVMARLAREEGPFLGARSKSVGSADGRFLLEDLDEGAYVLQLSAPGRAAAVVSGVEVATGASVDVGRIRLSAGGVIRGSVVDAQGASVPGATVWATGTAAGSSSLAPRATTDTAGAFELQGVPSGPAVVVAHHPDFSEARAPEIEVDPAKAVPEVKLVLVRGARIEGWVRRREGGTPPSSSVRVTPFQEDAWRDSWTAVVRPDGSFVVEHLPPGRAAVILMLQTAGRTTGGQQRQVELRDGETTAVEFAQRDILVSGHVMRSGAPAPNLRVNLRSGQSWTSYTGERVPAGGGPQRGTAVTAEDGSFELLVDQPGRFDALVETLDGRIGLGRRSLEIPDAETCSIELSYGGSSVAGVVQDRETGQPVAEASVFATPRKSGGLDSRAVTGPEGRFELVLDDGEYSVRAQAEGYGEEVVDVTVASGGAGEVRLALARGLALRGRLVDARGRGVSQVEVSASRRDGATADAMRWTLTLPDGSFQIGRLDAGPYNLFAGSASRGFAFRGGVTPGDREVVLTLRTGGGARLRVLGPDGQPVEGAWVGVSKVAGSSILNMSQEAPTNSEGLTEIAVPAGPVEIDARTQELGGTIQLTISEGETTDGEIRLSKPPSGTP